MLSFLCFSFAEILFFVKRTKKKSQEFSSVFEVNNKREVENSGKKEVYRKKHDLDQQHGRNKNHKACLVCFVMKCEHTEKSSRSAPKTGDSEQDPLRNPAKIFTCVSLVDSI